MVCLKSFDGCMEVIVDFLSKNKGTKNEAIEALLKMEGTVETPYQSLLFQRLKKDLDER